MTRPEKPASAVYDRFLPDFDVRERHELAVRAPAARAYASFRRVDLSHSLLVRLVFAVRTVPGRLRGKPWGVPEGAFVDRLLKMGWVILEERPGHELVAGAVTRPWEAVVQFRSVAPEDFRDFAEPGYVKIVWGFAAVPSGPDSSLLITETRARATDDIARARFKRYWLFVGTGVRLIRRVALQLAREDLRQSPD